MAGVAGRSGRKLGSQNDKPWREALALAANELDPKTKQKKLRRIAQAVIKAAMDGDMTAAKEVGDRLDGKPRQETDVTVNDQRTPRELSDAELAALIAAESAVGDADEAGDTGVVH